MTDKKSEKPKEEQSCSHVHIAVNKVKAVIAKEGISKDRKNQQQGYSFRGIDDVYNAMAPILADADLNVYPTVLSREVTERATKSGGVLFYVTVRMRFDFTSAIDGSVQPVEMYGEAMDSGDKATNKAMSAAYKYACMQTFCIPTEGNNDADSQTHEVAAKEAAVKKAVQPEWPEDHPITKEQADATFREAFDVLEVVSEKTELDAWKKQYGAKVKLCSQYQLKSVSDKYKEIEAMIAGREMDQRSNVMMAG